MEKKHENTVWVPHAETLPEAGPGVTRRVLATIQRPDVRGKHL